MAAKKSPAKKKPAAKKAAGKKAAGKKTEAKKAPAKKAAAKKAPAKKAAAKKAAAKKPPAKNTPAKKEVVKTTLDAKFVAAQKARLEEERSNYVTSAKILKDEADSLMEGREPGDVQFDEESGEGDSLAVERERDLALSAHARAVVDQIDEALERVAAGTYGVCVESGKPIPKERLKAIPWAAERVEYKAGGFRRR